MSPIQAVLFDFGGVFMASPFAAVRDYGASKGLAPDRVLDAATFEKPLQYSEGIRFVLVNGTAVVSDGKLVAGALPGRPARAPLVD